MSARVLVVDDDVWVHRVVDTILAYRGCEVLSATSGEEALAMALALPHPPHLIISDVLMPGMDGFTLIRQLRAQPQLALTPVIFLTALDRSDDRMQGYRLGADDYLPKPFHAEELDLRVGRVLIIKGGSETLPQALQGLNFNACNQAVAELQAWLSENTAAVEAAAGSECAAFAAAAVRFFMQRSEPRAPGTLPASGP